PEALRETTIAVPGLLTSAYLELCLYFADQFGKDVRPKVEVVPFDEIIGAVQATRYAVGLIIHEGQLTYGRDGLVLLADMGVWWKEKTGL
ncbi:MqnA/MqnD/SBP family protein, partial [Staphylococcus aureus]